MTKTPIRYAPLVLAMAFMSAAQAAAQLRPVDPLPSRAFNVSHSPVQLQAGFGLLGGQRAALAGTEGTLIEVGTFRGVWRTGRVALEVGGTVLRLFEDESRFADPHEQVEPGSGPRRRDAGAYRIATSVRLTPEAWPTAGFVRFGTRLPTTDNTVGLDRDRTDFFATVGAQRSGRAASISAEAGVGIFGTRHERLEQSDVLMYALTGEYRLGLVTPILTVLGHADGMPDTAIRGSEELAEVRLGARAGDRLWVGAEWVRGLTPFSPEHGLLVSGGWTFD